MNPGSGCFARSEPVFTTAPEPRAAICGTSARHVRTRAHQVDVDRLRPALVGDLFERRRVADPEVVDHDVRRAAERVEHGLDRVLHALAGRQIRGNRATPLVRLLPQHVAVLIADQNLRALAREQVGDGLADAMRPGAHIGGPAAQLIVHLCPRPSVAVPFR